MLGEALGTKAPPINRIRVTYYEGGGAFGGASPYDDTAQAAALMSALVGKPVRLQFMRWDSTGWGNYGPPMLADLRGSVDPAGRVSLEFTGNVFPVLRHAGRRSRWRPAGRRRCRRASVRSTCR